MPPARVLVFALLFVAAGVSLSAQQTFQYLGPNECLNCHDHDAEREWYEKKEIPEVRRLFPDKGDKAGHINSLNQLEAEKSNEFAKAIGLADKYDLNGACVTCHATVYRGDANAGVSCESCHGPGSGYLKPHQTKDTYEQSVAQYGMTKLIGNMQGWTQQCTNCHVMNDDRLIKAGHPAGDDFDLGQRYLPVSLHFKKKYAQADVTAIGKQELEGIIRRRRGQTATVAAAPPPAPAVTPAPAPEAAPTSPAAAAPAPAPGAPVATPTPAATAPAAARTSSAVPAQTAARLPAAPPPGSPTSIEPPPPLPGEAPSTFTPPPAPAAAPPAAPAAAVPAASGLPTTWLIGGGVLIVALAAGFWLLGTKSRK